jgi:hypothetical protein
MPQQGANNGLFFNILFGFAVSFCCVVVFNLLRRSLRWQSGLYYASGVRLYAWHFFFNANVNYG